MTTTLTALRPLTMLAATALLALTLAGCAPAADTSTGDDDTSSSDESSESGTDDGGFVGATLPGTGVYSTPDQAPIGSYELPDNQDGQPDGCTWTLSDADGNVLGENQGSFIFITDVTAQFTTNGCPDWVQYE